LSKYQGQVHAESTGSSCLCIPAEPNPQQNHQCARSVYRGASILHRIFSNKGGCWFISAFENSRVEVEWVKLLYDIAGTIAQLVL